MTGYKQLEAFLKLFAKSGSSTKISVLKKLHNFFQVTIEMTISSKNEPLKIQEESICFLFGYNQAMSGMAYPEGIPYINIVTGTLKDNFPEYSSDILYIKPKDITGSEIKYFKILDFDSRILLGNKILVGVEKNNEIREFIILSGKTLMLKTMEYDVKKLCAAATKIIDLDEYIKMMEYDK